MMSLLGLPKADTKSGSKAGCKDEMSAILGHVQQQTESLFCCVNYRKSICPTMMSLLGLPKADTKSGSKAVSKDEMPAILGHVQ